jgi:hypothetical protein
MLWPVQVQAEPIKEPFCPVPQETAERLTAARTLALPELKTQQIPLSKLTETKENAGMASYQAALQQSVQSVSVPGQ